MQAARIEHLRRVLKAVQDLRAARKPVDRTSATAISPWKSRIVQFTPELERIAGIPRRDWEPMGEELADQLTPLLRTTDGNQRLYPVQAVTLHDLYLHNGAVGIIRVGGGKSLITFLAPYVVSSFRPLLLLPGNLVEKTKRHMKRDRFDWEIPNFIRVESYEKLGHPNHGALLHEYKPDLIMLDEASKCKNTQAICTKRIGYYMHDTRRGFFTVGKGKTFKRIPLNVDPPKVLALSGTLTNRSLLDYWHILRWVLPQDMVPLPNRFSDLIQWSLALDVRVGEMKRVKPGALLELCNEEEKKISLTDPMKAARRAYRRRLLATPGVISTSTPYLGSSLTISARKVRPPAPIRNHISKLWVEYVTPDGWELEDAHVVAMRVKELALGFFYRWNPRPPEEYIEAHQAWAKTCRGIIRNNRQRIDSEGQVIKRMRGKDREYPQYLKTLENWQKQQKLFGKPNTEAIWVSDFAIDHATQWMKQQENQSGIVWVAHTAFGKRLSEKSGVAYYGEGSVDKKGRFIESHPPHTPMIASIPANYQGKNLQHGWHRNLIMAVPSSGEWWEQLLGRTHREGQEEDCVSAEMFMSSLEALRAFWSAVDDGEFAEDMESARKLLYADVLVPTLEEVANTNEPFWTEQYGKAA